jgi:hypothetical protein
VEGVSNTLYYSAKRSSRRTFKKVGIRSWRGRASNLGRKISTSPAMELADRAPRKSAGSLIPIVAHRRKLGEKRLCNLPASPSPSLELRGFLDELGLAGLSHHGLRTTRCTKAALAGIPETACMQFVNHASREVHAIYQRLSSNDVVRFFDLLKK